MHCCFVEGLCRIQQNTCHGYIIIQYYKITVDNIIKASFNTASAMRSLIIDVIFIDERQTIFIWVLLVCVTGTMCARWSFVDHYLIVLPHCSLFGDFFKIFIFFLLESCLDHGISTTIGPFIIGSSFTENWSVRIFLNHYSISSRLEQCCSIHQADSFWSPNQFFHLLFLQLRWWWNK